MTPTVTIIMATYNRAHFIVETLHSIQKQTFQDWECLIIDDGGADNTFEVLESILENDFRFKFLNRPATYLKGLPGSRNYGLDLAQGDYVVFFDDDDVVHPMNLELCLKELENSTYSFCRYLKTVFTESFDYQFDLSTNYDSFVIGQKDIESLINYKLPLASCTVIWRKNCFDGNRFVEHLMYAEEWELYSRILSNDITGLSINKILFFARKHSNSNTAEFYANNSIRKKSNRDAILLVISNLKVKGLLSNSLLRYFIQIALGYTEYKMFDAILNIAELSSVKKMRWRLFYGFLPLRLYLYSLKKKIMT